MGYQPRAFILRSSGDVLPALKRVCASKECEDIFKRWQDLHKDTPKSFNRVDVNRVKAEVLKVVHSLQENFTLINELNSILPPTFTLSCHPDVNDGTRTNYFVLLSDSFRLWGEIYPTRPDETEGIEPIWSLDDVNRTVGKELWHTGVKASQRDGWLPCLLDLLSWELEYPWLEIGFRRLLTCTQADLVKEARQLPFTCHYKDLKVNTSSVTTKGPAPKSYEGTLHGHEVWVQFFESDGNVGKFETPAVESALACRNIQHPNLVSWTSIYSTDDKKWILVTPRSGVSSMQEYYKGSRTENDRFKLNVVRDIAEALYYLNCIERWRGCFTMADVFVDGDRHCRISHHWDSSVSEERQPVTTYVVKHPKRFEYMQMDGFYMGRLVHQMYPYDENHRSPKHRPGDTDPEPFGPYSPVDSLEELVRWLLYFERRYLSWVRCDLRNVRLLIDKVIPQIELHEPSEDSDSDDSTLVSGSPVSEDVDDTIAGFAHKGGRFSNLFKSSKSKQMVRDEQDSKTKTGFSLKNWSLKGNKRAATLK